MGLVELKFEVKFWYINILITCDFYNESDLRCLKNKTWKK